MEAIQETSAQPPAVLRPGPPPTKLPGMGVVAREALRCCTREDGLGPSITIGAVAMVCAGTVGFVAGGLVPAVVLIAIAMLVGAGLVLMTALARATNAPLAAYNAWLEKVKEARGEALQNFERLVPDRHEDWLDCFRGLQGVLNEEQVLGIGDDVAMRLRDLRMAYNVAVRDAGRSDTSALRDEATKAAISITSGAIARHREVHEQLRARDEERAPDVVRRFAEQARAVAGLPHVPTALPPHSASAALQRLIGIAEDALAVDPDLVDAAGARVDALVRRHLPRLLEAHAGAARTASREDLSTIDDQLAEGVEQVRASIEEALAADARRRFDKLQEEVAFLKMRRDG